MISLRKSLLTLALLVAPSLTSALSVGNRRAFLAQSAAAAMGGAIALPAMAAPEIKKTADGKIKYATLREAKEKPASQNGDIVAIEYTVRFG